MTALRLHYCLAAAMPLLLASCAGYDQPRKTQESTKIEVIPPEMRVEATGFTLYTPSGQPEMLSAHRGKIVVLNFWATWCGPCRKEIPYLVELHDDPAFEPVYFLGVSLDLNQWDEVKPFAEVLKIDYPLAMGTQEIADAYTKGGLPTTVFIDSRGKVAATYLGLRDKEVYKLTLTQLIEEDLR